MHELVVSASAGVTGLCMSFYFYILLNLTEIPDGGRYTGAGLFSGGAPYKYPGEEGRTISLLFRAFF